MTEEEIARLSIQEEEVIASKVLMAHSMKSWIKCQNCKKAVTELLGEEVAKCDYCQHVQKPDDCDTGYSVQLNLMVSEEPRETLWVIVFEDILQILLDNHNNAAPSSDRVELSSADDDIYASLLSLPKMLIHYHLQTKAIKTVNFISE